MVKFDALPIFIPAHNETRDITQELNLLGDLELVGNIQKEIILANDCSTDTSAGLIVAYAAQHPALGLRLAQHTAKQV